MNLRQIKNKFKYSKTFGPAYARLKKIRDKMRWRSRLRGRYSLENRSKGSDRLCIVLAGYKEFLYPAVMGRLKKYTPSDMDICIMTSGLYSESMSKMCAENGWSYLCTKRNNVSLIQNIAIHLHPKAEYIFKLDEDIFITEGYFENMIRAYHHAEQGDYVPGVIAPLIPVNPYGNVRVLEKFGLSEKFTEMFEKPKYSCDLKRQFYKNPEAAKFFWGEGGYVPNIDEMNKKVSEDPIEERACPVQFSIGAILFKQELWIDMMGYPVSRRRNIASDELALCSFCCLSSRPLMVTENVLVGHLSYLSQNATMKKYYMEHQDKFMVPETPDDFCKSAHFISNEAMN